jgi:imidazole glycerol-phosphate synthase subunit HisH
MIAILDYGMGNPGSIQNMLQKIGGKAVITADHDLIDSASAIILPGVGAFDNGMLKLRSKGIVDLLEIKVKQEGTPLLGICLGMQLLFSYSEEGTEHGLDWVEGKVRKFDFLEAGIPSQKIPHMGWNTIQAKKANSLFKGLEDLARFYFVHSYHAVCDKQEDLLATAFYGYDFACAVQNNNIYGVQFHPEKSHRFGMVLLKNFLEIIK